MPNFTYEKLDQLSKQIGGKVSAWIDQQLADVEGEYPPRRKLKALGRMIFPPGESKVSPEDLAIGTGFPQIPVGGITKMGKEYFANAIKRATQEGRNIYMGYHATRSPNEIITGGITPNFGVHELYKGRGMFVSPDPFLGIAQRSGSTYQNPKYFFSKGKGGAGVVRMVLTPEQTFTIEEPVLRRLAERWEIEGSIPQRMIWNDVLNKLGGMTKLTTADLYVYPSKGVTEYIVRDPAVVGAMSWRGKTHPGSFPPMKQSSFEEMADYLYHPTEQQRKIPQLMYEDILKGGKIEKGVREFGLPAPSEYSKRELQELAKRPETWKNMSEILEDIIQGHHGKMYKPMFMSQLQKNVSSAIDAYGLDVAKQQYKQAFTQHPEWFKVKGMWALPVTHKLDFDKTMSGQIQSSIKKHGLEATKSAYSDYLSSHPEWFDVKLGASTPLYHSPIPLTPVQEKYLKAIFGNDYEIMTPASLQQALRMIKASPLGYSSIHPETVKTIQMQFGMIPKEEFLKGAGKKIKPLKDLPEKAKMEMLADMGLPGRYTQIKDLRKMYGDKWTFEHDELGQDFIKGNLTWPQFQKALKVLSHPGIGKTTEQLATPAEISNIHSRFPGLEYHEVAPLADKWKSGIIELDEMIDALYKLAGQKVK